MDSDIFANNSIVIDMVKTFIILGFKLNESWFWW